MRLFWVIFKHCARRRRRRLGIWKIWRWLSDGHWDAHCVLPSPFVLFLFPTSIFLLFFLQEETIEPLLSIMDDDHRSQVDENYYSLLGMKYEKYGGGKEAADQKEKWC